MSVRLLEGEALKLLPELDAESVEAVITDPPYSSGGAFRSDRISGDCRHKYQITGQSPRFLPEFLGDNRDQRGYQHWCALWMSECLRVTKPGGVLCVFTDWRQLPTTTDALQAGGWIWRGIVVWDKTEAARPDKGRFRNQCEYVAWGSKGGMPEREDGPCLPGAFRLYGKPDDKVHIAGKPVGLMRQLLRIVPPGGIVLDPFMGGGSTGIACVEEGLGFVGMELDPYWFVAARDRILGSANLFSAPVMNGSLLQGALAL